MHHYQEELSKSSEISLNNMRMLQETDMEIEAMDSQININKKWSKGNSLFVPCRVLKRCQQLRPQDTRVASRADSQRVQQLR